MNVFIGLFVVVSLGAMFIFSLVWLRYSIRQSDLCGGIIAVIWAITIAVVAGGIITTPARPANSYCRTYWNGKIMHTSCITPVPDRER